MPTKAPRQARNAEESSVGRDDWLGLGGAGTFTSRRSKARIVSNLGAAKNDGGRREATRMSATTACQAVRSAGHRRRPAAVAAAGQLEDDETWARAGRVPGAKPMT